MKTRYKNPWYINKPRDIPGFNGWKDTGHCGPEFYESDAVPVEHGNCLIYERQDYGYPIFDVVLNGMCVTQRAGLNGAKRAIDAKEWEEREWWKKVIPDFQLTHAI